MLGPRAMHVAGTVNPRRKNSLTANGFYGHSASEGSDIDLQILQHTAMGQRHERTHHLTCSGMRALTTTPVPKYVPVVPGT